MKKTPLRKKSKSPRSKLIVKADTLWSIQVRVRDNHTCRICGKNEGVLHAHHIFAKRECGAVRWSVDNGVTLCWYCHKYRAHTNPEKYRVMLRSHLVDGAGLKLNEEALKVRQWKAKDIESVIEQLKQGIYD